MSLVSRTVPFRPFPVLAGMLVPIGLAALSWATPAVAAAGLQDIAGIDRAVAAFTGQSIGVPGGAARPVDRRLRLAACAAPLALSWRGEFHASILVECPDPGSWHIFVATAGGGRADPSATPVIQRGQLVTVAVTGDGFAVSQSAEAMEAGAVGAWIRVRTGPKTDPVQARVVRPGLVEVPVE
ncbi:flagella basal body P-ring formation protein FlgA [Novosphingobium nitrogenifigens]|uniref:flagella basal body P-ring formation protein FlgA n=1 Tax=Novosphingobium nitrogenifigens TaxID=378548 RepID=UPI001E6016A9|nr:flagella basal body P-ring formation protein FlgA [Novosphingobium nitrogenifigens]